jgi:hypothetical protein
LAKSERVHRPIGKSEYKIFYASRSAERGWIDLLATRRSDLVVAWEFLTKTPLETTPLSYRLRGELANVNRDGVKHDCWQLKLNARDGARIWYYVYSREVHLIEVHTHHPHQTR